LEKARYALNESTDRGHDQWSRAQAVRWARKMLHNPVKKKKKTTLRSGSGESWIWRAGLPESEDGRRSYLGLGGLPWATPEEKTNDITIIAHGFGTGNRVAAPLTNIQDLSRMKDGYGREVEERYIEFRPGKGEKPEMTERYRRAGDTAERASGARSTERRQQGRERGIRLMEHVY